MLPINLTKVVDKPDRLIASPRRAPRKPVVPTSRWASVWRSAVVVFSLLLSDTLIGLGGLCAALAADASWDVVSFASSDLILAIALGSALWIMLRLLLGLYPGYGTDSAQELRLQSYSSVATFVMVLLALVAVSASVTFTLYLLLMLAAFVMVLLAPVARHATKTVLVRFGLWGKPVVVLGGGRVAARLVSDMVKDKEQGFRPVGVFSNSREDTLTKIPYLGHPNNALVFARNSGINTAVIAAEGLSHAELDELAEWASTGFRRVVKAVPSLTGLSSSTIAARDLSGVMGVEVKHNLLDPWSRRIKRAMDLLITLVGGTLIAPLFLFIAALVWMETRGSVLYIDRRLGSDGRLFSCMKFRTMLPDAEDILMRLLEENPEARAEYAIYHKLQDDPRVTRIGQFLRKTSLDELPQLWNVLKGEMSLVGPRPYLPRESADIGPNQRVILRVPPGISGLWQVSGRSGLSFNDRVEMDRYYIRNWSVWMDFVILARTVADVIFRRGAY